MQNSVPAFIYRLLPLNRRQFFATSSRLVLSQFSSNTYLAPFFGREAYRCVRSSPLFCVPKSCS